MARRRRLGYTDGELNKLVDGFVHPHARKDLFFWLVDGALHSLVEENPGEPIKKFVAYDAPEIIKQVSGQLRKHRRRHRESNCLPILRRRHRKPAA